MECNRVSVRPIVRLRRAGYWPPTSTRVPVSASPPAHGLKQHHELIHLENRVCYLLGHPSVEWGDAGVTIAKLLISQIIKPAISAVETLGYTCFFYLSNTR